MNSNKEDKIKEDIIIVSQRLFKRYGYIKTTMEDISKAIGKKKSSLYYYYKSKDEILEATVIKESIDVLSKIRNATENTATYTEKLRCHIFEYFKIVHEKVLEYDVLQDEVGIHELYSTNLSFVLNHINEPNEQHKSAIRTMLISGVRNKEFRNEVLEELDYYVEVIFTVIITVSTAFAKGIGNERIESEEIKKQILLTELILRGLIT